MSGFENEGADKITPLFINALIRANPKRLSTNLR